MQKTTFLFCFYNCMHTYICPWIVTETNNLTPPEAISYKNLNEQCTTASARYNFSSYIFSIKPTQ